MEQMENLLNDFEEPQYNYVGFWPRFGALFIDGIILIAVAYLLRIPFAELDNKLVVLIVTAIIPLFYNLFLEYKYGATLGKMLLKIKIVNYELQPPSISNVILRNIIYIGLQFVSFAIDLNSYFKSQSSDPTEFIGLSSYFTPEVVTDLIYAACIFVIYIIEVVFLLNDPKCRALHDRIGKTYVVKSMV
jgi:uncharacterized RDD family membrane protein YckC